MRELQPGFDWTEVCGREPRSAAAISFHMSTTTRLRASRNDPDRLPKSTSMSVAQAIRDRRSIKRFTDRAISREEIEHLLDAAIRAPNHHLTQPWRFYVLGPEARHAYGLALGERKARKQADPDKARTVRENTANDHRRLPAMIVVAVVKSEEAEVSEENYAATMMAVQNMMLRAHELGLGTAIRTGAVMSDPAARAAVGVPDDQRIVAAVNVGEPADVPQAPKKDPASTFTTWRP